MGCQRQLLGSAAGQRCVGGGERVSDLRLRWLRGVAVLPRRVVVGRPVDQVEVVALPAAGAVQHADCGNANNNVVPVDTARSPFHLDGVGTTSMSRPRA